MSCNKMPTVDKCCGCVTDLKSASAIIAVYAIVTSPAITWAVIRHAYVIRLSCYITTQTTRPDVVDINLSHVLSFGFGANAGLGPSCLGPYTDPAALSALKDPAKSQFVAIVKHIGWLVLLADIIFLLFSINFLAKIFMIFKTKDDGKDKAISTIARHESTERKVSAAPEPNAEASAQLAEKPAENGSTVLPDLLVWENNSPESPINIERASRGSNKWHGFHSQTDQAPIQNVPEVVLSEQQCLPNHLCLYLMGSRVEPGQTVAPGRRAAAVFMITAIVAIAMSFLYTILYVSACMTVGGSFPIFELFFSIIDVLIWVYFLIVVNSYRLTLNNNRTTET